MSWWEALILGIVQGITEFLPVSSSGHLELARIILGENKLPEDNLFFTVILHFATALGTIWVFKKDVNEMILGAFKQEGQTKRKYILLIVLSMLPAAFIGLKWDETITTLFSGNMLLVGCSLLFTAIILWYAQVAKPKEKSLGILQSFIIGIAQAIAILPGVSRSGSTIATSLILGINRQEAARFSFLMVIPLIFGKMAKDILDLSTGNAAETGQFNILPISIGFFSALIVGIIACKWMIKLVQNSKLSWFALYCAIVGLIAILSNYA